MAMFRSSEVRSSIIQLLVEVVLSMTCSTTLQLGDVTTQLLDGFHLFLKELSLNEVCHLKKMVVESTVTDVHVAR